MPAEPTLADLLRHTAREVKLQIRTHAPATVISYDAARQTVRVRVDHLLTKPVISAADTARTLQQQPGSRLDEAGESIVLAPVILDGVPVAWLSTSTASFVLPMSFTRCTATIAALGALIAAKPAAANMNGVSIVLTSR